MWEEDDVNNKEEYFVVFDSHRHASIINHDNDVEYTIRKCSKNVYTNNGNDIGPTCTHLLRANNNNQQLAIIDINNDDINIVPSSYQYHLLIEHTKSNTDHTITINGTIVHIYIVSKSTMSTNYRG